METNTASMADDSSKEWVSLAQFYGVLIGICATAFMWIGKYFKVKSQEIEDRKQERKEFIKEVVNETINVYDERIDQRFDTLKRDVDDKIDKKFNILNTRIDNLKK